MTRFGKMKEQPRIKKARKQPTRESKSKGPMRVTGPWGRGASEYRPGRFTKDYLMEHSEGCAADIFYALREYLERLNKERVEIDEKPIRGGTYNSFAKYWHWFKLLGLIEPVDRREPATYDFLEEKVFYRLTDKGRAEVRAWDDPVAIAHPELR